MGWQEERTIKYCGDPSEEIIVAKDAEGKWKVNWNNFVRFWGTFQHAAYCGFEHGEDRWLVPEATKIFSEFVENGIMVAEPSDTEEVFEVVELPFSFDVFKSGVIRFENSSTREYVSYDIKRLHCGYFKNKETARDYAEAYKKVWPGIFFLRISIRRVRRYHKPTMHNALIVEIVG